MLTPPEKKRPTQNVFGPDCSSMSATPLLKPLTIAPITITTITPIATPRIVSAARALWARSDSSAMPTPSSSGVTGSLLARSEEHTSELQSQSNLVCRLLLEKKKKLALRLRDERAMCKPAVVEIAALAG